MKRSLNKSFPAVKSPLGPSESHLSSMPLSGKSVGTLFVIATPIGNLDDLSKRAVCMLQSCNLILAEDTRSFRVLASRYQIVTPVQSYYDHNEEKKAPFFVEKLLAGTDIALVSDAGTPTISDPGYRLIKRCHEHHIPVKTIPGPCAAIAALSISGLETNRFCFEGFLPMKKGKWLKVLQQALERGITTIFYESPYRILKTLETLEQLAPLQRVFVARELTKIYEESFSGTVSEVKEALKQRSSVKGEVVLIVGEPSTDPLLSS